MKGIIYAAKFARSTGIATSETPPSADSSPRISEDLTTTFVVHLDRHEWIDINEVVKKGISQILDGSSCP